MGAFKKYISPSIIKEISIALETDLLAGSTVNKSSEVKTTGQEIVTMDFSQPSFNQEWDK